MILDPAAPALLTKTQKWFASIITRPIDENSSMMPISPTGNPMDEEAWEYIAPSPTLKPARRIEIYNQQYWWRLLNVLHENLPLVLRLFGYVDFNQTIAFSYLVKYPPNDWSLSCLGDRLPLWIEEEYTGKDKPVILLSAKVDCAYSQSFLAADIPSIDLESLPQPGDIFSIADKPLKLQPHMFLFEMPYDLFEFRKTFIEKEPDYWIENDFPKLTHFSDGELGYFVLYRNQFNQIEVKKIGKSEYQLIKRFESTASIDEICEWLEKQPQDSELFKDATEQLSTWFERCISHKWLAISSK